MTDPAPQERVELFLERAEVLRSSSAVASIDQTAITLRFGGALGDADAELVAPGDEATLVYFARLRHFDTPKTDVYVRDFFPNLDAGATARRKLVVEHLSQAHADLGRRGNEWPKIVMGASATPRAVWEFWTYSQVLHTDPNKRAAWSSLNAMQQEMAKFVAFGYAGDLFHLVTVVEAMLRDPALDDRGVHMQLLTVRPEFAGRPGIEPFEAAKVRLFERPAGEDSGPDETSELSLVKVPNPQSFPPVSLDGGPPIPIEGWRHGTRVYAYANGPVAGTSAESGKWYALILKVATRRPEHAWPCDTAADAQGIAAHEYLAAIGRPGTGVLMDG